MEGKENPFVVQHEQQPLKYAPSSEQLSPGDFENVDSALLQQAKKCAKKMQEREIK